MHISFIELNKRCTCRHIHKQNMEALGIKSGTEPERRVLCRAESPMTRHQERNEATGVSLQHQAKHRHGMGKELKCDHWMLDAANCSFLGTIMVLGFCLEVLILQSIDGNILGSKISFCLGFTSKYWGCEQVRAMEKNTEMTSELRTH